MARMTPANVRRAFYRDFKALEPAKQDGIIEAFTQQADQSAQQAIVNDKSTIYADGQSLITAIQGAIAPFAPETPAQPSA